MSALTQQSLSLPTPVDHSSPFLICDGREEIGWRTVGWPKHQQETCILVPFGDNQLIAVSLFNVGLSSTKISSRENLDPLYPILANIIARHFELLQKEQNHGQSLASNSTFTENRIISCEEVTIFFESSYQITITPREAEIFSYLLQGDTMSAVSDKLCISVYTARTHRRNVYRKIGHGRLLELISQFHVRSNV